MKVEFEHHPLNDAAALWAEVTLDAAQQALVRDLGTVVGEALGIDPIPCRGMWLQAVRAWQRAHHKHAVSISQLAPPDRLRAAFEIKDCFMEIAGSMLVRAADAPELRTAVDAAYGLYMAKYNHR